MGTSGTLLSLFTAFPFLRAGETHHHALHEHFAKTPESAKTRRWRYGVTQETLPGLVDNIRADRSAEDLLFQVLLDWGVDLALPISQQTIAGKTVFFVDGNALAACFETGIAEDFVKQLAAHKPLRVVFRDSGFVSDSVKINVEQVFKLLSPDTEIKTL
ncbi:MAG: hypothetical protein K9K30_16630 [Burkholderiaceae bacterium]|nr:hypothetical protein [Sulfuritalea sp.]MCF8176861.1 hypothetical protein [Burkholderiaceae bacterium]MCF8184003.1 hypothetical protein [Polynucleobacter sp.]